MRNALNTLTIFLILGSFSCLNKATSKQKTYVEFENFSSDTGILDKFSQFFEDVNYESVDEREMSFTYEEYMEESEGLDLTKFFKESDSESDKTFKSNAMKQCLFTALSQESKIYITQTTIF